MACALLRPFCPRHTHMSRRFLYARLQLEALRSCINTQDLEDTLEEFPADIEIIYAKTWERILAQGPKHANLAKLIFLWILFAETEITVDLLRQLVSTCPQTHIFQAKRLVPEAFLVSVCYGLVSIDPKTRHIRLIRKHSDSLRVALSTHFTRRLHRQGCNSASHPGTASMA